LCSIHAIAGASSSSYKAALDGVYRLKVITASGCNSLSDSIRIVMNPAPQKPGVVKNSTQLTVNPAAFNSYLWFKDNAPVAAATQSVYIPTASGLYFVKAGNAVPCYSYSDTIPFFMSGVHEEIEKTRPVVYPNPAHRSRRK
jgi:hypothetical protein